MEVRNLAHVFVDNEIQVVENVENYERRDGLANIRYIDIHGDLIQHESFHDAEKKQKF